MTKISINNHYLHKVRMKLRGYARGTTSYLLYPEYRLKTEIEGEDKIIIKLPQLLLLELYRSAIIPQNEEEAFHVSLDSKDIGLFRVIELEYPDCSYSDELITLTLERTN